MHSMADLQQRLANRVQLTTDGHGTYLHAVEANFGADIDYAILVKQYGKPADPERPETRYSERQNLTMRMSMRRMTRLTNAFSKKVQNLEAAVACVEVAAV
jgi:hypothetical protein